MIPFRMSICAAFAFGLSAQAHAQSNSVLIEPSIPIGFDTGRNVSVTERPRPDYDAQGIPVGGFNVYPSIEMGGGFSDNVYLTENDKKADGYAFANPALRASSDWSRHALQVRAQGRFVRYFDETPRNENTFFLGGLGRADLSNDYMLTGEAQFTQQYESPINGEVTGEEAVLSKYQRGFLSMRGEYRSGRFRGVLAGDQTTLDFKEIRFLDGTFDPQRDRDRTINRVTGQLQYAFTPSTGVYGQISYADTNYRSPLSATLVNRDSEGVRILGGLNMDLAGFLRGTVGIGYVWRDYKAPIFKDVKGFSAEAKVEYFFSPLTTFTLAARRVVEDSSIGDSNAFFDNRVALRVDHELLRNLILNAQVDVAHQTYVDSPQKSDIYRISAGARYLSSDTLNLNFQIFYNGRDSSIAGTGRKYDEIRFQAGIVLQR